ncbi:hypothetical protein BDU57DRAFT_477890 [Ampelomyces quisqualis]|uniref:RING-type domain-containing protein n=1 Tax=Ampelomyces quisqualis TaxID=50730 RepID=A0A6A5QJ89_AMPQU|nr:hypothetical protein BDU57DRAFT_477890 [Ampelomyces quisqualis]
MTAHRIGIFTIDFPDPAAINYDNKDFVTLNHSVSFQYQIYSNIQTLSTKGVDGSDPYGLLYVPDLASDACRREELQHVPANATRLANLPAASNYALIAAAPWFSPQCMLEYFAAARRAPTNAIYVWQPAQGNGQPPVLNDPSWNLQDGGGWQRANTFPTYALPATTGDIIMTRLNQYSGNLSTVPYADQLARSRAATDYVRLWSTVSTESGTQLPSLWVFLVIVLAILIVAVSGISVAMHVIQRRRRNHLRQRVLQGEVDLEALGVKRLNVDQQTLDKLPIYTYTVGAAAGNEKHVPQPPLPAPGVSSSPPVDPETGANLPALTRHVSAPTVAGAPASVLSQPTCPICLDDFEANQTQVRELPCRHIFHPDCIDTFLLRNSSLCPMCKHSVLPPGVCPVPITNMMVRRERHITRMRARSGQPGSVQPILPIPPQEASPSPGPLGSLGRRIGGAMAGRRTFSASERAQRPPDIEMANNSNDTTPTALASMNPPAPNANTPVPPSSPNLQDCSPTRNRREWARQRALQMLGTQHAPASDVGQVDTRPKWRRTMNKVFPGFR